MNHHKKITKKEIKKSLRRQDLNALCVSSSVQTPTGTDIRFITSDAGSFILSIQLVPVFFCQCLSIRESHLTSNGLFQTYLSWTCLFLPFTLSLIPFTRSYGKILPHRHKASNLSFIDFYAKYSNDKRHLRSDTNELGHGTLLPKKGISLVNGILKTWEKV